MASETRVELWAQPFRLGDDCPEERIVATFSCRALAEDYQFRATLSYKKFRQNFKKESVLWDSEYAWVEGYSEPELPPHDPELRCHQKRNGKK